MLPGFGRQTHPGRKQGLDIKLCDTLIRMWWYWMSMGFKSITGTKAQHIPVWFRYIPNGESTSFSATILLIVKYTFLVLIIRFRTVHLPVFASHIKILSWYIICQEGINYFRDNIFYIFVWFKCCNHIIIYITSWFKYSPAQKQCQEDPIEGVISTQISRMRPVALE